MDLNQRKTEQRNQCTAQKMALNMLSTGAVGEV